MFQIEMDLPAYALPVRFYTGTTYIHAFYLIILPPWVASLETFFQVYHTPESFLSFDKKIWCRMLSAVRVMSDLPWTVVQTIAPHVNRILLLHIHLYQETFLIWRPHKHVFDEKISFFSILMSLLIWPSGLWYPWIIILGFFCVYCANFSSPFTSRLFWYVLNFSPIYYSLESLSGSVSG